MVSLSISPSVPHVGDTITVSSSDAIGTLRVMITSVPLHSQLVPALLDQCQFVPDVVGNYGIVAIDESETHYAPSYFGGANGSSVVVNSTTVATLTVSEVMTLPIHVLSRSVEIQLACARGKIVDGYCLGSDYYAQCVCDSSLVDGYLSALIGLWADSEVGIDLVSWTNSLVSKYNSHLGNTVVHKDGIADSENLIINTSIGTISAAMNALNEIKTKLQMHGEDGYARSSYHLVSDGSLQTPIGFAYDLNGAMVLALRLARLYSDHLNNATVHNSADTTNSIDMKGVELYPLVNAIVDGLEGEIVGQESTYDSGAIALSKLGFNGSKSQIKSGL